MNVKYKIVRYIGKCKRGCKCVARVEGHAEIRTSIGDYGRTVRQVKVTFPNGATYHSDTWGRVFFPCLCGKSVEFSAIVGRATEHKCGARCLASTSGVCECACGGKNHGASYAA